MNLGNYNPSLEVVDDPSKPFRYLGDVNELHSRDRKAFEAMTDSGREVTYRTMCRRCDVKGWARARGYGGPLHLKDDYAVTFYRSTYRGRPCYYLTWSGYEYVWVPR